MSSILDFRGLYFCATQLNLTSSKQFKKNFYYARTRLFAGQREWPNSYDWVEIGRCHVQYLINTITEYRKQSIQSQTTESLFLQRTQEQNPPYASWYLLFILFGQNLFNTLQYYFEFDNSIFKTFQESKTLFFLICKRRPLLFVAYDIQLCRKQKTRAVYIYTHYLFSTKETVQYTDSKEIKTMLHSILCRFLSAFLKIY